MSWAHNLNKIRANTAPVGEKIYNSVYMKIKMLCSIVHQALHASTSIHTCLSIIVFIRQRNKRKYRERNSGIPSRISNNS
ncbi:hypothetical protein B9Z19DRAFT_221266 [Tuber borchii]|uniref:Uncharacterized protein n=1 Tax=Tuber borchii TaxID=42251 RepID=A0A2T6ZMY0_TUBBO|nr:hypothetical protein B9Z19DRAFT_221266 [Tuber borchii]